MRPARVDTPWTLAFLYGAVLALSLPLQQRIWFALAMDSSARLLTVLSPLIALSTLMLASAPMGAWLAPRTSEALADKLARYIRHLRTRAVAFSIVIAALMAALGVAYFVLDAFPNSGDEYAYLFQARQFAHGRLWAQAPPLGYTFVAYRTWLLGGKWLSQYPPGWPLALAVAIAAGIPTWIVNPLWGAAGVAGLTARSWRFASGNMVLLALVLYLLTPFFLLNAGSFHSHMFSACLIVLLCLCCLGYLQKRRYWLLLAAGALIGLIAITRYFSFILLIPALLYWYFAELRRDRLRTLLIVGLGVLPFLVLLLAYQYFVTGDPLRSTYALITDKDASLSIAPADLFYGMEATVYHLVELCVWASPVFPVIYLLCLILKLRARSLQFYDLIFPTFVLGFIFFPSLGGNRYGPRYYFEAFPLMLATVLSVAPQVAAWARRWWERPLALHAAASTALYLIVALPLALSAYHAQVERREEPYRLAASQRLRNAVVIVESTSGGGLLAEDLARNEQTLDAPVLYARKGSDAATIVRSLPARTVWVYRRADPDAPGELTRVR